MLHIPWVGYSLPVVGLLDASKDEVANVKESLLNDVAAGHDGLVS
jgi:hypothetical protein